MGRIVIALLAVTAVSIVAWRLAFSSWRTSGAREMAALAQMVSTRVNLPTLAQTTTPTPTPSATPRATRTWTATPQPTLDTPVVTPTEAITATPDAPTTSAVTEASLAELTLLVHVIAKGDLLGALATRYGVTVGEIARANAIQEDAVLTIGQQLVIPVTPAENAEAIAAAEAPSAVAAAVTGITPTPTPTVVLSGLAGLALQQANTAPSLTPTPASTPTPLTYAVAKGDNLGSIAVKHGIASARIAEANGLTLTSVLSVGQILVIPGADEQAAAPVAGVTATAASTPTANRTALPTPTATPTPAVIVHTVEKGDTLGGIAVRYGVSSDQIAATNGLTLRTILRVGQELRIPGVEATPESTLAPDPMATPTPTPTPAPTLTRLPTPQFPYREPSLLWPTNGSAVSGPDRSPVLNWTSVGILGEHEWYLLEIWNPGQPEEPVAIYTTATSFRLTQRAYPQGRRSQRFAWQVTVVHKPLDGGVDAPLSPPSLEYAFTWR
jgi:LysM repeat protein